MKNPIATMRMGAEILNSFAKDELIKRQATTILKSTYELERQVNVYSDYARLQLSGSLLLYIQDCDETLFNAIEKRLNRLAIENNVVAHISGFLALPTFRGDKTRITTLLELLFLSAVQYHTINTDIHIVFKELKNELTFQMSFQLETPVIVENNTLFSNGYLTQNKQETLGVSIELFVAASITHAHNGSIALNQDKNTATFEVKIPK